MTPKLTSAIEILSTASLFETFAFLTNGQPRIFPEDTTYTGALKGKIGGQVVKVPIDEIDRDGHLFTVNRPPPFVAGIYDFSLSAHHADGVIETLITGKVKVTEGPEA